MSSPMLASINFRSDAAVLDYLPIVPTVLTSPLDDPFGTSQQSRDPPRPNRGLEWAVEHNLPVPMSPAELYPPCIMEFPFSCGRDIRFVPRTGDTDTCLIYTCGVWMSTIHRPMPAAWAFVYGTTPLSTLPNKTSAPEALRTVSGLLEQKGPFGQPAPPTEVRAHLRAILAALRYRPWEGDAFNTLIIATNSRAVADGLTKHAQSMTSNGFRLTAGTWIEDADMWMATLGEIECSILRGLRVQLWHVPKLENLSAHSAAQRRSESAVAIENFTDYVGVNTTATKCAYT